MDSVAQIEEHMRRILGPGADRQGRVSGFIGRQRQVSGSAFAQGLIFGWMQTPDARIEQLCQGLGRAGASISASGLSQRFSKEAVAFLETLFEQMTQLAVRVEPAELALLKRFSAVRVQDSSQISLPDELYEQWKGCGNAGKGKQAGLKVHVQWDLLSGQLWGPVLTEGKHADQRSPLRQDQEVIPAGGGLCDRQWLLWLGMAPGSCPCGSLCPDPATSQYGLL